MDIQTAMDLINESMVYKPGYTFVAEDYGWRLQGGVLLTISMPTPSTDRQDARDGYRKMLAPLHTAFVLQVGDCVTEDDLWYQVLKCVIDLETHEAREFLRIKPSYHAPFHPHRLECMRRYARYSGGSIEHDQAYGSHAPAPMRHTHSAEVTPAPHFDQAALLPGPVHTNGAGA